jgi:hypothetical protein
MIDHYLLGICTNRHALHINTQPDPFKVNVACLDTPRSGLSYTLIRVS